MPESYHIQALAAKAARDSAPDGGNYETGDVCGHLRVVPLLVSSGDWERLA